MDFIGGISPKDLLKKMVENSAEVRAVDVRSPGEFSRGALPGFVNLPILTDDERHQVGLCFKTQGQTAAVELGHSLVTPYRSDRIQKWVQYLKNAPCPVVSCWRGGLRSDIATQWIRESGQEVFRLEGGYKALRAELMLVFEALPDFLVLAGPTGSGKTELLKEVLVPKIDLEYLAVHRGSAFGKFINADQPCQATFENKLSLRLLEQKRNTVLIEDESLAIGQVHLPAGVKEKITTSQVVKIKTSIDERLTLLYDEYVRQPLERGIPKNTVQAQYEDALNRIKNKLGGLLTSTILGEIRSAFASDEEAQHRLWIQSLLVNYYDKMYEYSFNRNVRRILFEGDWQECKSWIQNRFA